MQDNRNLERLEIPLTGVSSTDERIIILRPGQDPWVISAMEVHEGHTIVKRNGRFISSPINISQDGMSRIEVPPNSEDQSILIPLEDLRTRKMTIDVVGKESQKTYGYEVLIKPKVTDTGYGINVINSQRMGDQLSVDVVPVVEGSNLQFVAASNETEEVEVSIREGSLGPDDPSPKFIVQPSKVTQLTSIELIGLYTRRLQVDVESEGRYNSFELVLKPYFDGETLRLSELVTNMIGSTIDADLRPVVSGRNIALVVVNKEPSEVFVMFREI